MVELLVVLVIIVVLAGLVVVAISTVSGTMRDRSTQSRLEMLDGFMAAYANAENATSGGKGNTRALALPSAVRVSSTAGEYYSTIDGWVGGNPDAPTKEGPLTKPTGTAAPYPDFTRYPAAYNDETWVLEPAVARTQAVMRTLLRVRNNADTFATVSDDAKTSLASVTVDGSPSLLLHTDIGNPDAGPLDPPLLLDGHGQIIIFVPPAGLTDITYRDGTVLDWTATASGAPRRLVASHRGAFWASPGADGDFSTGDDNLYSTEVIVERAP